jgi:hypothetical protein
VSNRASCTGAATSSWDTIAARADTALPSLDVMQCTLVLGLTAAARETAISTAMQDRQETAVLLEGLPDGQTRLLDGAVPGLSVVRIAPGCICCAGNLVMRVHLNRLLRQKPQRLFIGIAATDHLAEIRRFLSTAPYEQLLELTNDIHA